MCTKTVRMLYKQRCQQIYHSEKWSVRVWIWRAEICTHRDNWLSAEEWNHRKLYECCTKPVRNLLLINKTTCTKSVRNLYEICTKTVRKLYEICTKPVRKLYENCTKSVRKLYEICTKPVRNLYENCTNAVQTEVSANIPQWKMECKSVNLTGGNLYTQG